MVVDTQSSPTFVSSPIFRHTHIYQVGEVGKTEKHNKTKKTIPINRWFIPWSYLLLLIYPKKIMIFSCIYHSCWFVYEISPRFLSYSYLPLVPPWRHENLVPSSQARCSRARRSPERGQTRAWPPRPDFWGPPWPPRSIAKLVYNIL